MRDEFKWYFGPSESEIREIWEGGVLTLDANVLLDLYRYHENTRQSLLACIERFKGRVWLSRQAAEEFFRNRAKVVISASSGFGSATDELGKLRKALSATVDELRANRILPTVVQEKLETAVSGAIAEAEASIERCASEYPKFFDSDPVMDRLLELFSGSIGADFDEEQAKKAKAEGEARRRDKVPPGYLDDGKPGDRPLGDFFLWRQVLDHAKQVAKPILLVTSERKDDWWERHSGQTVGPRQELVREAFEHAGHRVLIYRTDRFLELAAEQAGGTADTSAVEEIRAVDNLRSTSGLVRVHSQSAHKSTSISNAGTLTVETRRPSFKFTASGHFNPQLACPPTLSVRLLESPMETPSVRITAGTGTNHDFHVHLKSEDYGVHLPSGTYVFEYEADARVEALIKGQEGDAI